MALKLRVISDHYKALGKRSSRLFGVTGGRIGRAQDNDWILPDPDRYISSHHCKVVFRAGEWILEDTSTNGVFINGADVPACVAGACSLQDGDRLRLGDYEVIVSIDERNDFPADADGQQPAGPHTLAAAPADDLGEVLDLTDLLNDPLALPAENSFNWAQAPLPGTHQGGPPKSGKAPAASSDGADVRKTRAGIHSLLGLHEEPENRTRTPGLSKDDWQMQTRPYNVKSIPLAPARGAEPQAEQRLRRTASHGLNDAGAGVEAFCHGAGIDPAGLPAHAQAALLTLAGQMVREMVLGLMDAYKLRTEPRTTARRPHSSVQQVENNPLKLAGSVDEAVFKLFDPDGERFLAPLDAIRDSFADLRNHQGAFAAALHAGVDELMRRIEPRHLQERFDRDLDRGPLLGLANKLKYWDLYNEFYQSLNRRNEQGLPPAFAEELARAYADQLAQKTK